MAALSRASGGGFPELRVRPADELEAIFRFHAEDEIDFDVDLRALRGQERLDVFCDFLRVIGRTLGKPVLMDPEGDHGRPVLGYDVEDGRVVLLTEPPKPLEPPARDPREHARPELDVLDTAATGRGGSAGSM